MNALQRAALSIALPLAVAGAVVAATVSESRTLTFHVQCEGQGIVDQPHEVTLTLTNGSQPVTITTPVLALSSSDSIAGLVAAQLNAAGVPASSSETSNPKFENSPGEAQDVTVGGGYEVTKVTVEKLVGQGGEDDGHLRVYAGEELVSGTSEGAIPGFSEIRLTLHAFTGIPLAMEFDMYGAKNQRQAEWHKSVELSGPTMPMMKFLPIGSYLETLGFTVTYPSQSEMVAVPPANIKVGHVYFSAFEATNAQSPATHLVSYSLDLD